MIVIILKRLYSSILYYLNTVYKSLKSVALIDSSEADLIYQILGSMGQTLSEPVTTKHTTRCENEMFKVGSSSMQGWRVTMEGNLTTFFPNSPKFLRSSTCFNFLFVDAHTHILELPEDSSAAFFGVFDGHGGSAIAKHAASNLHKFVVQRPEYKEGDIPAAITQGFLELDDFMQADSKLKNEISGTTAVTCLLKENKLYCGNAGDSRAIACINGKCIPLSYDHKPNNPIEEARIKDAGGFVEFNRVNGNLALSRALGDFGFKRNFNKSPGEQMVSALPDVEVKEINEDWDFILLACDGIWDVVTNEEACELVRYPLGSGIEPAKVCEQLIQTCLAPDCNMGGLGCDNMTAVLVCLLHGKSWESYCSKIADSLDGSVLEYSHNSRGFTSVAESSDSDDEDAIPVEKMADAKTIAASLSYALANSNDDSGTPIHVINTELADMQSALHETGDFVHQSKTGELVKIIGEDVKPPETVDVPPPGPTHELLGSLNVEVLSEMTIPQAQAKDEKRKSTDKKDTTKQTSSPGKKN